MNHLEIINYLIEKNNYKSYLEIGVEYGTNFNSIRWEHKECCDTCECVSSPSCNVDYIMTSDEMFEQMSDDKKYDIIFIDAMHDESYVDRDVENSMKHLNENGVICLHDSLPISEDCAKKYSTYSNNRGTWCGDVFKSIVKLNQTNLNYITVNNDDLGLTIIKHNNIDKDLTKLHCEYEYNDLFNDGPNDLAISLMNVVSVNNFINNF